MPRGTVYAIARISEVDSRATLEPLPALRSSESGDRRRMWPDREPLVKCYGLPGLLMATAAGLVLLGLPTLLLVLR
jgi:hypothetical protein